QVFGMVDRGVLREGAYADLVLFDPNTVMDNATFENPVQMSVGIEQVWANGVLTFAGGKETGEKPGRLVTRNR
ncbi:MAG: D-aminoacylase, partial [Gammaproteobacteria bacterium]